MKMEENLKKKNYCRNMTEENIGKEYSLKNIDDKEIVSLKK